MNVATIDAESAPILPFTAPGASLRTVGGKGLNLARLAAAGFPVPDGFLITTAAYTDFLGAAHLHTWISAEVQGVHADDPDALAALSDRIRARFRQSEIPSALATVIADAYGQIGASPVAVRSSATAEDLPDMSFAGQQDTFLNVVGETALIGRRARVLEQPVDRSCHWLSQPQRH